MKLNKLKYNMKYTSYTGKHIDLNEYYKQFNQIGEYTFMEGVLGDEYNFVIVKGDYYYLEISLYQHIEYYGEDRVNIHQYYQLGFDNQIREKINDLIVKQDWNKTKENLRKYLITLLNWLEENWKENKIRCRNCYKFQNLEKCIKCQTEKLLEKIETLNDDAKWCDKRLKYQLNQLEYLIELNSKKREHYYHEKWDYDDEDYKKECECKSIYRFHHCEEIAKILVLTKNKIKKIKTEKTKTLNKIKELNKKIKELK